MNRSVGGEREAEVLPDALPDKSGRQGWAALALHLIAPASFLVAALVLPAFMLNTTRPFRGPGLGPAAWPQVMLALVAVCAAIWLVQEFLARRRARAAPVAAAPGEVYSYAKAVTGLVMILAYGWLLPVIGFPITTATFIALWCVLGGVRNPVAVVPLSLVGTGVLLWVFMGLALMPLSRGQGIFDRISIAVLQMLGIY
ncbi:MAG: tripartite tricarboxylate transporter TctB family protein [Kiloniellaceae bacterium]